MSENKLVHQVNINFNDVPKTIGRKSDGSQWIDETHSDEIIDWAKSLIHDLPDDVHVVAIISGRMIPGITVCVAFAIMPLVDEIQYSGTNVGTLTVWKRIEDDTEEAK